LLVVVEYPDCWVQQMPEMDEGCDQGNEQEHEPPCEGTLVRWQ
jgi:hypothetical protein